MNDITLVNCPAIATIDNKERWVVEMPNSTYQNNSLENLVLLLCDLFYHEIKKMDDEHSLFIQIVKTPKNNI